MSDHFPVDFSEKKAWFQKAPKMKFLPTPAASKKSILGYFEQNDFWAKYLPTDPLTASWLMSDHFPVDFSEKKAWFQKAPNMKFLPTPAASKKSFWGYFEQNDFWAKYLPTDPLTASWLMSDHFPVDFSEKKAWFQKAPKMKFLPTPAASKKSILRLFWAKWFLS